MLAQQKKLGIKLRIQNAVVADPPSFPLPFLVLIIELFSKITKFKTNRKVMFLTISMHFKNIRINKCRLACLTGSETLVGGAGTTGGWEADRLGAGGRWSEGEWLLSEGGPRFFLILLEEAEGMTGSGLLSYRVYWWLKYPLKDGNYKDLTNLNTDPIFKDPNTRVSKMYRNFFSAWIY